MNKTIEIDGKKYEIDLEKAEKDGYLKEITSFPLKVGDVYHCSCGWANQLLIQTQYNKDSYSLIGLDGLTPFNCVPANASLSQLQKYLAENGYKFSHNINKKVAKLIENPDAKVV
jgi:hypothetical protein